MRFDVEALVTWCAGTLTGHGLDQEIARSVATVLVEGDLLGHDTHGLALLGPYIHQIRTGGLSSSGTIDVITDRPAALLWDGNKLPGPWLVSKAIEEASSRARAYGTASVVIRRAGHIACLASYLEQPARDGFLVEIFSSDPAVCSVAPFGGKRALFTPNPLGVGIPSSTHPIMIDISSSITTNGMSARLAAVGERFPGRWLLDAEGKPTDEPSVFAGDPPGTIQLLGGLDAGHKGYGLALWVESLTGGLAGYGRADRVQGWGASVQIRLTDSEALGGRSAFDRQIDWLVERCRSNPAIDDAKPVRLPGERGLKNKQAALRDGLALHRTVLDGISTIAEEAGLPLPDPLTD